MAEQVRLKNLEALRCASGMTIEELMMKLGRNEGNRSTYYGWMKTGQIKVADIIKLHELFGVSTDCILDVAPLSISG